MELDALWREAFGTLKEKHRSYLQQHSVVDVHEILQDAEKKRDDAWKARVKVRRPNGEKVALYDIYGKIAHFVKKFIEVGDIVFG